MAPCKVSTPYPPCLPSSSNTSPVTLGKLMSVRWRARECRWTDIYASIQLLLREEILNRRVASHFLLSALFIRETLCGPVPPISSIITKGRRPFSCIEKRLRLRPRSVFKLVYSARLLGVVMAGGFVLGIILNNLYYIS